MTIKRVLIAASVAAAVLSQSAFALDTPRGGHYDSRVKYVNYNPSQVTKLVGVEGFSTDIQFAPGENVTNIAMGDPNAWDVAPVDNHIFIKPIADNPATNMTVLTTRRVYNFDLYAAAKGSRDRFYQVNFRYPEDEAKKRSQQFDADLVKQRLTSSGSASGGAWQNWNYWTYGARSVSPVRAWDDGRFTYFRFANNGDFPAIYKVQDDGSEVLINGNPDPKQPGVATIQVIGKQFIMRSGNAVARIYNESYSPTGLTNTSGTAVQGVKRVIRGGDE